MTTDLIPPTSDEALAQARATFEAGADEFMAVIMLGTEPPTIMLSPEHPSVMFAAIQHMIKSGDVRRPDWIAMVSDTYYFNGREDDEHPGSLAKLFKAGDPRVSEALVATCVAPDGPSYMVCQTYERLHGGAFEWGEPFDMPNSVGMIPHEMQRVVTG